MKKWKIRAKITEIRGSVSFNEARDALDDYRKKFGVTALAGDFWKSYVAEKHGYRVEDISSVDTAFNNDCDESDAGGWFYYTASLNPAEIEEVDGFEALTKELGDNG